MTKTTDTFEDRLLEALLERFDALTGQAAAPVRSPRRVGLRRYAVPIGCLAAAVTAASVLVETGAPAPARHPTTAPSTYALAAWTTHPTVASPAQISTAENLCSSAFGQPGTAQTSTEQKWQPPPQLGGPWTPVLVDTRGDLTLALYSDGSTTMACLAGPSFVSLNSIDAVGESPVADDTASLDKVSTRAVSGDSYTFAVGLIGSGVTSVGLQRVDGTVVTATTGHGRFIAWWPQDEGVKALLVTTASGTHTYPVDSSFARSGPQPTNKTVQRLPGQPSSKTP